MLPVKNRHAIRLRNTIAALWVGFGVPLACVWILIADRQAWLELHPAVAAAVLVSFVAPLLFIGWLEFARRRSKGRPERP
jgi:hypothetical protein